MLGLLVTADRALGSSHVEDIDSTSHRPRSFDDASIPMAPTDEDVVAAELAKLDVTAAAGDAGDGNDDDDASGDEAAAATADGTPSAAAAKKKKKKKKKKKAGGGGGGGAAGSGAAGQTAPPTVPVSHLFNNVFPEGEIQHYKDDNVWRETSEEKRELERLEKNMYNEVRQCSEVHREVRRYISDWVKPGMKLIDVCGAFIFTISVIKRMGEQYETDVLFCFTLITETLENSVRRLIEERGLEAGIAFPTGCSQNHIAAHWTPNGGDNTIIDKDDVIKFDFGTQINGQCQPSTSSQASLFIFTSFPLFPLFPLFLFTYGHLYRPHHRLRVYKDVQR